MDKNLFSWADEVEREEEAEGRALKFELRDGWHEGLEVRRDQSRHRLDLSHGFMREIVRNQRDRDRYEQAWQQAYEHGDEYQKKWGRAKVHRDGQEWGMPEPWRGAPHPTTSPPHPSAASTWVDEQRQQHSKADDASWWRRPTPPQQSGGTRREGQSNQAPLLQQEEPAKVRLLQRPAQQAPSSPNAAPPHTQQQQRAPWPPAAAPSRPADMPSPLSAPESPQGMQQYSPSSQQYVLQYAPQRTQQVASAPVVVQLHGGGYALMSPQAAQPAQQLPSHAPNHLEAQGSGTAGQGVMGRRGSPEKCSVQERGGAELRGAAGAGPSEGLAGEVSRRAVKVRAGFSAYRPPPVLTGESSTSAQEVAGLLPHHRRPAQAPLVPAPPSPTQPQPPSRAPPPQANTQPGRPGQPSSKVKARTTPRTPQTILAVPAAAPPRGHGGAAPQLLPAAGGSPELHGHREQVTAVEEWEESAGVAEEEGGMEGPRRRRRPRGGKKNRKGGGEGGSFAAASQGGLEGVEAGVGEDGDDIPPPGMASGRLFGRLGSAGRRRAAMAVLAEQCFDDDGAASGMGDVSGTSPASTTTPHAFQVTLSNLQSSRAGSARARRKVTQLPTTSSAQLDAAELDACSDMGLPGGSQEEEEEEEVCSGGGSMESGGALHTLAGKEEIGAGMGEGAADMLGAEGGSDSMRGVGIVVSVAAKSRAGRRDKQLSPSPTKSAATTRQAPRVQHTAPESAPRVLSPPLGIRGGGPQPTAASGGRIPPPSPLFAAPSSAAPSSGGAAARGEERGGQAPKRVTLGPMSRMLRQSLQQAVHSRETQAGVGGGAQDEHPAGGVVGTPEATASPDLRSGDPSGQQERQLRRGQGQRSKGKGRQEDKSLRTSKQPPGSQVQVEAQQENSEGAADGAPPASRPGPSREQALMWRQERVLQRLLRLERVVGVCGSGEGSRGRAAAASGGRRGRVPLMIYMPPRGAEGSGGRA